MAKKRKIGRDAGTGKFIPVQEAERRKKTAVVETIPTPRRKKKRARSLQGRAPNRLCPDAVRVVLASQTVGHAQRLRCTWLRRPEHACSVGAG